MSSLQKREASVRGSRHKGGPKGAWGVALLYFLFTKRQGYPDPATRRCAL